MEPRRLLLSLGAGVTALVVVAAVASRGRPLAGSSAGTGPTASFFDYVFTTTAILGVIVVAVAVWSLVGVRRDSMLMSRPRHRLVSYLLALAGGAAIALFVLHSTHFLERFKALAQQANRPGTPAAGGHARAVPPGTRGARLRWDEVAVAAALLAGAAAFAYAGRPRSRRRPPSWRRRQEAVSFALDESLDDLRTDPDLRRAIVAAYARMEGALGAAGIPRHPSEAPLEYMERALTALDTSAAAVRRLTVLFEWAKFSQHEPEPRMRDEAIDALVAVRDELRAPAAAAA